MGGEEFIVYDSDYINKLRGGSLTIRRVRVDESCQIKGVNVFLGRERTRQTG